jgi:hypothetical protein
MTEEWPQWLLATINESHEGAIKKRVEGSPSMTVGSSSLNGPLVASATRRELPKPLYREVLRLLPRTGRNQRRVRETLNVLVWKTTGRNDALNWAAWRFREFVAEGLISDADASRLLEAASELNGYTAKDGIRAVRATIASGLRPKQLETAYRSRERDTFDAQEEVDA